MVDILIAVVIDLIFGDPEGFPHPVRLFGRIISYEERLVRKIAHSDRGLYFGGFFIVVVNVLLAFCVPFIILKIILPYKIIYHFVNIYFLYACLAARCLRNEAVKIYRALEDGLEEARYKLSFIVGRDTKKLNKNEIIRAVVETVAENTSDGVIAPLIFMVVGGAPAALLYKMINTMDSMLGYLNEKYKYIGFFPAKTDDVLNFIPARLTGVLMNLSCILRYNSLNGFKVMIRDRRNHKSPNCAYPEGAVAGLLGVQLGGDNSYFGEVMKKPTIGDFKRQLEKDDIKGTIEIMFRAELLLVIIYLVIGVRI
jgi:adenosylcobinamide-phosphate synthase